jgi:hypothetical protein
MKKIVLVFAAVITISAVNAQNKKNISKADLSNRAGDHIMLQLGGNFWGGIPDSIKSHKKGLSRSANVYVMMDKPFKSNPRFSAAFGVGIGTSNMYFSKYSINIKSNASKLPFTSSDSTDHFKKYKLTTAYLEVPVELRFIDNPLKNNKSLKAAIGLKVGTLLNVHTKGKTLQNKAGSTVNNYTSKESDKHFFNSTRIAVTGRIGYGNFSLFGSYQINALLKDGVGPQLKPYQIGICLSGL